MLDLRKSSDYQRVNQGIYQSLDLSYVQEVKTRNYEDSKSKVSITKSFQSGTNISLGHEVLIFQMSNLLPDFYTDGYF